MVSVRPSNFINEYYGLSTDTKPTFEKIPNGSTFYEMDTGDIYMWDSENQTWRKQ